jgi:cellulose synthase/poly-beta-1,6-N-acetylglucosamine synthase-like glycosyltransferase
VVTLALVGLSALAAVVLTSSAVIGRRELAALVGVEPQPLARALTVVVPARNEAGRIGATLDGLLADDSEQLRVVVYDDRSDDDTRAIVRARAADDARLTLIEGDGEPPADTFGKPHALARATAATDGDPLLFVDADVSLRPGALGGLLAAFDEAGADALSGLPRLVLRTVAEQVIVPVLTSLFGALYRPRAVHDDARADAAFLNGQLILISRAALADVGGWQAVSDTVLEDVALAGRLKRAGKRLRLADVRAVASTRMYESLSAMFEGFGKNAIALYRGRARLLGFALAALVVAWLPWAALLAAVLVGPPALVVTAGSALAVVLAAQLSMRRALAVPAWPILVGPLAYLVVSALLTRAALSRRVTWKGREYRAS